MGFGRLSRVAAVAALMASTACGSAAHHARLPGTTTVIKQHGLTLPSKVASSLIEQSNVLQLPQAVNNFGAAFHHGAIYLYGGYFDEPNEYALEGQSGELLRIDPRSGAIESVAQSAGVQGAPLVSTSAGLLRVGGMRAENVRGEPERVVSLNDVSRFDLEQGAWQSLAELPQARSSHAAVAHGDKLYVVGGFTLSGIRNTGVFNQDMLVLDLESGAWSAAPQPFRTRAVAAGVLAERIVVVGGLHESGKVSNEVHVFDPTTGSWTRAADFPEDSFGIAIASTGKHLYASARAGIVYELDAARGTWSEVSTLAFPRFSHQLVATDEQHLWALGGMSGMYHGDHVSHIEQLDLADPAPRVLHWRLHNPLRGQEELGIEVVDDALLVFDAHAAAKADAGREGAPLDAFSLELASLRAERIEPIAADRAGLQTTALEGQLLALGGTGAEQKLHADGVLFDVAAGHWLPAPALPEPRALFGLIEREAELWVLGGVVGDTHFNAVSSRQVLRARPDEPFFDTGIHLPRARSSFGIAQQDGQLFLVGGVGEHAEPVAECDALSLARQAWSTFPCPAPRVAPQLISLGGKLYLAGGASPDGAARGDTIEVFDPSANRWSTLVERAPVSGPALHMRAYRHALLLLSQPRGQDELELALIVPPHRT